VGSTHTSEVPTARAVGPLANYQLLWWVRSDFDRTIFLVLQGSQFTSDGLAFQNLGTNLQAGTGAHPTGFSISFQLSPFSFEL